VTGRDRTCDAPRFRRALYRAELRSRVEDGRSRSRTGGLLRIREALYHLSYPPSGRGWARTSSLLFVRQALSRLSYSPVRQIRDKGSNLDFHVQSVASCRLDDPGARGRPPLSGARLSVEERDVLHRTCALLGVHRDPVPAVQHDRGVIGVADRALGEQLGVADEPCPAAATPVLLSQ
jgi:hypothetical protein